MKRFIVAAALAVALGFGNSSKADAQIVYGYSRPVGSGIASTGTVMVPGGYQTYNSFYSPFTGAMANQVYSQNFLGQVYGRTYGYNPYTGLSYNSGFYRPNAWFNPYGGYNYGYVRRWGW